MTIPHHPEHSLILFFSNSPNSLVLGILHGVGSDQWIKSIAHISAPNITIGSLHAGWRLRALPLPTGRSRLLPHLGCALLAGPAI